jgi:hypothetical protein
VYAQEEPAKRMDKLRVAHDPRQKVITTHFDAARSPTPVYVLVFAR